MNWWNALDYVNVDTEILEVDLSFTIPGDAAKSAANALHLAVTTGGNYRLSGIQFYDGARQSGTDEGPLTDAQALAARRAFVGLSADLEPAVVVLPYHKPLP